MYWGLRVGQVDSLRTEDKFKKTEIGEIPVDWEVVNLGEVAQINMGQSPLSSNCFDHENGLPFFQGKAEFGAKFPKVSKWCNSPRKVAEKGEILVSVRAPVGDVNVAPEKCCIGRGLAAIRGTKSDSDFLYFVMNFVKNSLAQIGQGSTFEAINKNVLFELRIPYPPSSEQKNISKILLTVDEAIEKKKETIEKTKELKKGLMQELLSRGIGHKKFKKTKVGEIPVGWEVKKIADLCILGRGRVISQKEIDLNLGPYPVFSSQSKDQGIMGFINSCDFDGEYVTWTTDGAYAGTVFYRKGKFNCTNVCGTLKSKVDFIDMKYLSYALEKRTKKHVVQCGNPKLMNNVMAQIHIQIPVLSEQKKIAEILSSVDEEIEKEIANKEKLEDIKKGLMQVLLSGKIRVRT